MGRFAAGILVATLFLPLAAAIVDPAGDVFDRVGGKAIDAPYIDIRNVTATITGTSLVLAMELEGAPMDAPTGIYLNYSLPFRFDAADGDSLYGDFDGSIICSLNGITQRFSCADGDQKFQVTAAALDGRRISATISIPEGHTQAAVAGAASQAENGTVTGADFTDNALPYASRPPGEQATPPVLEAERSWNQAWLLVLLVAIMWIGSIAYRARKRRQ